MKKRITLLVVTIIAIGALITGCGSSSQTTATADKSSSSGEAKKDNKTFKIIADDVPHAELLEFVKPNLAKEGINIEVIPPTGGETGCESVETGEVDMNYFAHWPYIKTVNESKGFHLVSAGNIHVEPIGCYSKKYKSKDEIPSNAKIVIPNDASNEFRGLSILEKAGFIKLKEGTSSVNTTVKDIDKYLKPIEITEMDSAQILRVADDFDAYVTNTNKILEAGIDPNTALFREGADSPYANILVVKEGNENKPEVKAIYKALTTPEVKKFIEEKYKGAVVPAF